MDGFQYDRDLRHERIKQNLHNVDWNDLKMFKDANAGYDHFLRKFISLYDKCFPKVEVKPKYENNLSPWLTKVIKRFSGRKQTL